MKTQDIAMVILIAFISVVVSYLAIDAIFASDKSDETVKVKTMSAISSDLVEPDGEIFNSNAINPTVKITIGENGEQVIGENQQNQQNQQNQNN
ncbi:MAG: hypothetical protein Q4A27_02205 [bacterium]|nr:hypothetical protein [bacterium]